MGFDKPSIVEIEKRKSVVIAVEGFLRDAEKLDPVDRTGDAGKNLVEQYSNAMPEELRGGFWRGALAVLANG